MAPGTELFDLLLSKSLSLGLEYEFWPAPDEHSKKLLIVLHGRGDSPEGFHFLPGVLDIDALNILFLRAPDAYYTGYSWYDFAPNDGAGILRSRLLLFDVLDKLQSRPGFKATDIYLLGFSQGCLLCLDLALRYPKRLGGIVAISGRIAFEDEYPAAFSAVAKDQRIWMSHGRQDVDFEKSRRVAERLRELGISIDWNPFDKGHSLDEADEIPQIKAFLEHLLAAN